MPRHSREKSRAILIDGGYVTFSGTAPYYHYYLKDHLGSNRVVVSAPYQPERQKAINGVTTFQYSHVHDPWADYLPIRGALQMKTSSNEDMKHSLFDFWGYIWSLPEGQYEFQDGIFVKK